MQVTRQDLEERFQTLTDEVLLGRVRAGTLTPLALEVALVELRSRGIEAVAEPDAAAEHEESSDLAPDSDSDADPEADLVTVARFNDPLEANVLRACLESHGIFAFLWGEHLGTTHMFFSVITGGMRVQVRADQVEQAKEVIAAFKRGDLAIDEEPE
jgi:hypothetical protein